MNTTYKGLHVSWWAVPTDERATVTQAWEACANKPICSLPERLAMIKIVEDYKGKIWFETELGEGTTFFLEFIK